MQGVLYKNTFLNLSGENSRPTRKRVKNTPNSPNVSTCTIDFKKKVSAQQSVYNTNYNSMYKTNCFSLCFHRQFTSQLHDIKCSLCIFRVQTFFPSNGCYQVIWLCWSPKILCLNLGKSACLLKINRLCSVHML